MLLGLLFALAPITPCKAAKGTLYLVVAGIENYGPDRPGVLKDAGKGARKMARAFLKAIPHERASVIMLVDDYKKGERLLRRSSEGTEEWRAPNYSRLKEAVAEAATNAREKEDAIVFYFNGHGNEEGGGVMLFTTGFRAWPDTYDAFGVNAEDLIRRVDRSPALRKLIVLDACRDMPAKQSADPARKQQMYRPDLIEKVGKDAHGTAVLWASSGGQEAWYDPQEGMGRFSAQLLGALSSCAADGYGDDGVRDGVLLLEEVFAYAKAQTLDHIRRQLGPDVIQLPYNRWEGRSAKLVLGGCPCSGAAGTACCALREPACQGALRCVAGTCQRAGEAPRPPPIATRPTTLTIGKLPVGVQAEHVTIDGRRWAGTPMEVEPERKVRVSLSHLYFEYETEVSLSSGEARTVDLDVRPTHGVLQLSVQPPFARLTSRYLMPGEGPLRLRLPWQALDGREAATLTADFCEPVSIRPIGKVAQTPGRVIDLGKTMEWSITMRPIPAEVDRNLTVRHNWVASRTQDSQGRTPYYDFRYWLEGPPHALDLVRSVKWDFLETSNSRGLTSTSDDRQDRFHGGYNPGYGLYPDLRVTIELLGDRRLTRRIDPQTMPWTRFHRKDPS